uniref:Gypsy retrotransposon integrase-like protein 1 n=1 Tax=Oryzias latipes TaxID=8090 RepID=A0A3P9IKJ4_ORYLA
MACTRVNTAARVRRQEHRHTAKKQRHTHRTHQHGGARAKTRAPPHRQKAKTHTQDTVIQCTRCGDSRGHSMQQCPAREAVCNQCRKKGHYARVCRTKQRKDMKIAMVTEDSNDGFAFLGSMSDKNTISPWITEVDVNSHSTVFKIDTGADVTAVSETLYREGQFGKLEKPTKVLRGPGGSRLQVQGKNIATADVLSRAPVGGNDSDLSEEDINLYVDAVISSLPATESRLQQIKTHQENDVIVQQLKKCCVDGWPDKFTADRSLQPYLQYSGDLSVHSGLLLYGSRIVIPASLKKDILSKLHEGHLGITKCRARAKQSVWWPGLSKELTDMIEKCDVCVRERTNLRETLIPTEFPTRPWSTVGADLFQFGSQHYLIVVDYHSRYFEVAKLTSTTSEGVIEHFKSVFARHGIPDEVRTDNGPQFSSEHFRKFVRCWNFKHVTSSPHFPQSNGEAERAVRTVKNLLKKSGDPYLALMAYRSAPLANGYSPAELLMGRRIRTTVPMISSQLNPEGADMQRLREIEQKYRQKLQQDYNSRHRAHDLSQLQPGDHVWVKGLQERGTVVSAANTPRSYVIDTPKGVLRRNRYHLSPTPVAPETPALSPPEDTRGSVAPEEHEFEQETSVSERRFPVRARAPPAYLKDYVCSNNRN